MSELNPGATRAAAKNKTTRVKKKRKGLRWKVQLTALLLLNPFGVMGMTGICLPLLNCHACPAAWTTCPIGIIGSMFSVALIPWLALGGFALVGSLLGRFTCGWICPFGFIQDLAAKLPLPKWNPPPWTRWIKYGVLVGMVFVVAIFLGTGTRLFFCRICPAGTLAGSWYWLTGQAPVSWERVGFLLGFVALFLFVSRGFCRIICPIGAGLAIFNKISLLSVKFFPKLCIKCNKCVRRCIVDSGPMEDPRSAECMYCMDCVDCDALKAGFSPEQREPAGDNQND